MQLQSASHTQQMQISYTLGDWRTQQVQIRDQICKEPVALHTLHHAFI